MLNAISVLLSVLAENGVYYGNDGDAHNLWDRWQQHNWLNKYLHLQLYLHTASGYRRRLALNCSVIMNNKNNRDTPLLYHISNRNNLCPNREPPPRCLLIDCHSCQKWGCCHLMLFMMAHPSTCWPVVTQILPLHFDVWSCFPIKPSTTPCAPGSQGFA